MRVIDYSLIEADTPDEFVLAVTKACRDGDWVTSGGVCVTVLPGTFSTTLQYSQALVKYGP